MIWAALICFIPTIIELYDDRKGDEKKFNDIFVLTFVSLILALVIKWAFDIDLLRSVVLMWGVHLMFFDYLIVVILKRNGVISPHARWFSYAGKTSKIDQFVSRINPYWRLLIRIIAFGFSIAIFAS